MLKKQNEQIARLLDQRVGRGAASSISSRRSNNSSTNGGAETTSKKGNIIRINNFKMIDRNMHGRTHSEANTIQNFP